MVETHMTSENETKALAMVEQLAEKLGQTAETLWPEAIRYVVVDGIATVLASLSIAAFVLLGLKWVWQVTEDADDMNREFARTLSAAAAFVFVSACLGIAFGNLPQIFAPVGYLVTQAVSGVAK